MVCGALEIDENYSNAQEIHVFLTWRVDLTSVQVLRQLHAFREAKPSQVLTSDQLGLRKEHLKSTKTVENGCKEQDFDL